MKPSDAIVSDTAYVLPKTIDRTGECTFSPLFVAMDCLEATDIKSQQESYFSSSILALILNTSKEGTYEAGTRVR